MKNNITELTRSERISRLSDIENAKWFVDLLVAECGGEMFAVDGLILLLEAVVTKGDTSDTLDFADAIQTHLFNQSVDHAKSFRAYREKIKQGVKYGFWDDEESKQAEAVEEIEPAAVLDLSSCQPDQLNTKISELSANNELACVISGLLNNSKLPSEVYNGIVYGLSEISNKAAGHAFDTPEYISLVLENSEVGE